MVIDFVGICTFDLTGVISQTKRVYIPDVSEGNIPAVATGARAHSAFIAVPPNTVDHSDWGDPVTTNIAAFAGRTFWVFPLDGVDISFNPEPSGGSVDITSLPSAGLLASEALLSAPVLRTDLDSAAPAGMAARVEIPGGDLQTFTEPLGLIHTKLTVADNVVITATGFSGGTRTLTMLNPGPTEIHIANVDGVPVSPDDIADRGLYCSLYEPPEASLEANVLAAPVERPRMGRSAFEVRIGSKAKKSTKKQNSKSKSRDEADTRPVTTTTGKAEESAGRQFGFTLGPGCSNSQLP